MANQLPMANQGMNPAASFSPQAQFAMLNPQPKKGLGQRGWEYAFGEEGRPQFLPTQTGPQANLQNQTIMQVLSLLQGGQNAPGRFNFAPIRQEAQNRFQTETLPSLAERFTGLGDSQGSSGYLHALGRASSDFDRSLTSLESQFGQQQQQLDQNYLLNLLRFAFNPQFETQYLPATGGLFGSAAEGLGKGAGSFAGQAGKLGANAAFGLL